MKSLMALLAAIQLPTGPAPLALVIAVASASVGQA